MTARTQRVWYVRDATDAARTAKLARVGDNIVDTVNNVLYIASNTGTAVAVGAAYTLPAATTSTIGGLKVSSMPLTPVNNTGGGDTGNIAPVTDITSANAAISTLTNTVRNILIGLKNSGAGV